MILFAGPLSGGTALTARLAAKHRKPCFKLNFDDFDGPESEQEAIEKILVWIRANAFQTLNIAGPRKSSAPELSSNVFPFLTALFRTR